MTFDKFNNIENSEEVINEINMTPLIDVMLVLLVIFILTAPLLNKSIKINLPKEVTTSDATNSKIKNISISIDKNGDVFYNQQLVNNEQLFAQLKQQALINPEMPIEINADKKSNYESIAKVLSGASQLGLYKIAFIMEQPTK